MKRRFFNYLLPAVSFLTAGAHAQGIKVMPGTTFKFTGTPYNVVLADGVHFENNAAVTGGFNLKATGSANSEVKGSGSLSLNNILMNKAAGQQLILQKNINVADSVFFAGGLLNLNGYDLVLSSDSWLVNENEVSRITGSGGAVQITQSLDAPLAENPGNLGLIITSGANWGSTQIRRSPAVFTNVNGGSSIRRSFRVTPSNNTGLSAFLRMYYFDAELNALNENTLDFYRSDDNGTSWSNIGAAGRNTTQNFVNINGIQTMSLFTLSVPNNPLPLQLHDYTASCTGNKAVLQWRIDNPAATAFFGVDKSRDGATWENAAARIDVQPSAAYTYTFTDIGEPYAYYRLQAVGPDGTVSYTPVQQVNCEEAGLVFRLLQNPVSRQVPISVNSKAALQITFVIYDLEGRVLVQRTEQLAAGTSGIRIDIPDIASGMYLLQAKYQQEVLWQTKFIK